MHVAMMDVRIMRVSMHHARVNMNMRVRLARRLATIRAGDDEPSPDQLRHALREVIGHCLYGVDVSGEMVRQAKLALRDRPAAFVYQNNGKDLSVVPALEFDFAFSSIVFQHIPSREIIENYVGEVSRLLRPGALFKFQVQGDSTLETKPDDTWLGVPFSERQAMDMAFRCGFEPRYRHGAGEQYFWLWFFKK